MSAGPKNWGNDVALVPWSVSASFEGRSTGRTNGTFTFFRYAVRCDVDVTVALRKDDCPPPGRADRRRSAGTGRPQRRSARTCGRVALHLQRGPPTALPGRPLRSAVTGFARALLADGEFLADLKAFVGPLVELGRVNSLAQTLIKLTAPGVPDTYQGTELWTLSRVAPNTRRPVHYETRRRLLAELEGATVESIVRRSDEGLTKLHLTRRALHLRRRRPEWLGPDGDYTPLEAKGPKAQHVVAFGRGRGPDCVAVAPRLPIRLGGSGMARPLLCLSGAGSTS
jgi:hypothetical protein